MKNKIYMVIVLVMYWLLTVSFSEPNLLQIPYPKIERVIKKKFKINNFTLVNVGDTNARNSTIRIINILSDTGLIGYVYVNRVNGCRVGGCSVAADFDKIEFEYFDYFFVTDIVGSILKVKVFNYQATQGHQIMSWGWLNQFNGYNGKRKLQYGDDIEAISGATVSAISLIDDIKIAEQMIVNWDK